MYLIKNGEIITEEGILKNFNILIENDRIKSILPSESEINIENIEVIDANGGYISPGFIDIHSDYIENMSAPRPTSLIDFDTSLRECEKVLINNGITTMYHSLSIYNGLIEEKPVRKPENVRKLINVIKDAHDKLHLIRHRLHLRFEIDCLDQVDSLMEYIKEGKVDLLSFMDHTPGQGQYRNMEIYKNIIKGYKGCSDLEAEKIIEESKGREKATIATIKEVISLAKERNIKIASHDDDTKQKIDLVEELDTEISEFPITLEVAKYAKEKGLYTIAGATNVLLGGSHSGNLSAAEGILNNVIDILCSDYYPASMLHSIFILNEKYGVSIEEVVKLMTLNPAKALGIDNEIGSIKEGKKADILIIEKIEDKLPVITKILVDGKLVVETNYRL